MPKPLRSLTLTSKLLLITTIISGLCFGTGLAVLKANANQSSNPVSLTANYYAEANLIVNAQFQQLFSAFDELDPEDPSYFTTIEQLFSIPPEIANPNETFSLDEFCQTNITSRCLENKLNQLYLAFEQDLAGLSQETPLSTSQSLTNTGSSSNANAEFINEQKNLIQNLNQQSIEFYRQVLFAYPMHIQNQQIAENLKQLLTNLKKLEDALKPYPSIFHNVTTAACQ
jgi:hypothetical protein